MPFFTLVVSTKGRSSELTRLLHTLELQDFRDFEVIVVDQNNDNRLSMLLAKPWSFYVKRIACPEERGLSRGRIVGWNESMGEFICFPDDDCWYDADFLSLAASKLAETAVDFLSGRAADASGRDVNGRFSSSAQAIRRSNVWVTQIEWVVFFRRSLLDIVGGYDVDIGVGAMSPWQSGEGQDLVLRALAAGATGWFDPSLMGRHAELIVQNPSPATIKKGRLYGRGMGHVLRRHRFGVAAAVYWVSRPLARTALLTCRLKLKEALYYMQVSMGRLEGVLDLLLPI